MVRCILELPPELLANIFLRLPEQTDRLNVRKTCRCFKAILTRPEFFRKRLFFITGVEQEEAKSIMGYLNTFGIHIQNLTLQLDPKNRSLDISERRISQLQNIFTYIKEQQRQLRSLKVLNLVFSLSISTAPRKRAAFLASLQNMLESQHRLSVVEFTDFYLTQEEGIQLLFRIATLSRLTRLSLPNLFGFHVAAYECPAFLEVIGKFTGLERVAFSYDCVSHHVLELLLNASPSLRLVLLSMYDDTYIRPTFTTPDWRWAVKKRPDLQLWVAMDIDLPPDPLTFISPAMPLVHLRVYIDSLCYGSSKAESRGHFEDFKRCIAQHRLRKIILNEYDEEGPWRFPGDLVELLEVCPYLTQLCLPLELTSKKLQQLTAAVPPRGGEDGEEGEQPTRPPLQIHIQGLKNVWKKSTLERLLQPANCTVLICDGCELNL